MKDFMSYADSLKILKDTINAWEKVEKVAITDALDRNIAYDVTAAENYPAKPVSAMDGYAFAFKDGLNELELITDLPAGSDKGLVIEGSKCVKTFTGSLMSEGTDTLVPVENVEVVGSKILIKKSVSKGFAVREVGESYKKGEILIKKGTRLTYAEIALLAELGVFHVSVFIRPRVAILATGSEIKDLGEPLENPAQIHSSNHVGIAMQIRKMGAEPVLCEIVRDKAELVEKAIINALKSADILVTTGGISMGDYDFVKGALNENFRLIIEGAAIKPGRHIRVAKSGDKYIFALPGFPYSAMVMCVLYVRVLINAWFGQEEPKITAIMDEDYKKRSPFLEFTAVNLENREGKIFVNLDGKKLGSSAIVNNLTNEAALLIIPKETEFIAKGEIVEVLMMPC
ncbi:molybdopterin molybdotransferase MoeA [Campylobacter concisus]|uniref:molybdopterin molybdotransferase MoeA n=1 Tax=Campylobacter concisus TaxID=199 RepID=UPI000CD9B79B|nr:molybdopterin molybdotransferase MoeA [Campylobacter concisus]QPH87479.1 molybdopterin molybdotransferase MoeA [Campylobacter concisus]QPI02424.1 molybdopterin molybdotransferase MoeA [Campylobacter concisus]